jgi:hypothetical protein
MTVITATIMDVRPTSTVSLTQFGNNVNKIITDITSINSDVTVVTANIVTLSTTTSNLTANVNTIKSQIVTINNTLSSNNISGITGLTGTGLVVRTGNGTFSPRTISGPTNGLSVTNGDGVAGNPTIALANDLAALEALASTGIAVRTAADTWAQRTLTGPTNGLQITNGSGVAGNPTIALANDLNALEALSSTGIPVRTATDTWVQRSLVTSGSGVSVTNGDGVSGNPTISIANDLAALEGLGGTGFPVRISADTWTQRAIGVTAPITITNGDGVAGAPNISVSSASNTATGVIQVAVYTDTIGGTNNAKAITPLQLQKAVGVTLQGYDANTVKSNATKTLTAGYPTTAVSDGTLSSGTYTPNPLTGSFREVTNNGAHTLSPPTTTGSLTMIVEYTNGASAGAITTSGWTKVTGDTFTTTSGNKFKCYISKGGTGTHLHIQAMQ